MPYGVEQGLERGGLKKPFGMQRHHGEKIGEYKYLIILRSQRRGISSGGTSMVGFDNIVFRITR